MAGMQKRYDWAALRARIDRYEKLMRLDKPIGILLLLWPTLWAVWLSGRGEPSWVVAWIFTLGTVLMRSGLRFSSARTAGCSLAAGFALISLMLLRQRQ